MAIFGLVLNIVIVILLGVTIGYCWLLNRRIKILQDGRGELAQLLKHFDESTERASQSIIGLQGASKKIGENMQLRIDKANYLIDDLSFMIEKGNKLANQMEAGFAENRARNRVQAEEPRERIEMPEPVRQVVREPEPEPVATSREKASATLEAVLERVVGRGKAPEQENVPQPSRDRRQPTRSRSKAEQELLDMIKAGIKG
jgi:hypothetical protein